LPVAEARSAARSARNSAKVSLREGTKLSSFQG